jgi:catechol 2,3-dioxygenase-like lactoylglutathione lyase family enzyme
LIDHVSLGVADLARSAAFYDAALGPLGYVRLWSTERGIGYGRPGAADEQLAIFGGGEAARAAGAGSHLAITAPDRASVDAFHARATAAGGSDEGGPGLRPRYGAGYYAAFVRDPDGHKLEAVHHER